MPYIKIDGSNNRVLRTVSDRLDLGPNGPKAITQLGITLVMVVVALVWAGNFWSNSGSGPFRFAPLIVLAMWGWMVVRSVRGARKTVEDGWRE